MINIRLDDKSVNQIRNDISYFYKLDKEIQWHPHITLFEGIQLNKRSKEDDFFRIFEECVSKYNYFPFTINGFRHLKWWSKKKRVIAHNVKPSKELVDFTSCMVKKLNPIAIGSWTDFHPEDKEYHITIAWKLSFWKAERLWAALDHDNDFHKFFRFLIPSNASSRNDRIRPIYKRIDALRLTIYKNGRIITEYDIPRKKWISANNIMDIKEWTETVREYQKYRII